MGSCCTLPKSGLGTRPVCTGCLWGCRSTSWCSCCVPVGGLSRGTGGLNARASDLMMILSADPEIFSTIHNSANRNFVCVLPDPKLRVTARGLLLRDRVAIRPQGPSRPENNERPRLPANLEPFEPHCSTVQSANKLPRHASVSSSCCRRAICTNTSAFTAARRPARRRSRIGTYV